MRGELCNLSGLRTGLHTPARSCRAAFFALGYKFYGFVPFRMGIIKKTGKKSAKQNKTELAEGGEKPGSSGVAGGNGK